MNYLSVCSGIEAATCAWHSLGWSPVGFGEIEPFPCAVLAHHFPDVPNLGDMTQFKKWKINEPIDLLVGGTPCQSFSIAGLRKGLRDPRGNLALVYLALADRLRPRWVVWENVPGVLSSHRGRDFGTFLGALAKLGYGWAYRVLDAQYVRVDSHRRAVPQRRRRVFVVGYLGDWRRAAAVLFEPPRMSGHTPPRRSAGQEVAGTLGARATGGWPSGGLNGHSAYIPEIVTQAMSSKWAKGSSGPAGDEVANLVAAAAPSMKANVPFGDQHGMEDLLVATIQCGPEGGRLTSVSPTLDSGIKDGPMRNQLAPGVLDQKAFRVRGFGDYVDGDVASAMKQRDAKDATDLVALVADTITADWHRSKGAKAGKSVGLLNPVISFSGRARGDDGRGYDRPEQVFREGECGSIDTVKPHCVAGPCVGVRRLTPLECERLQGFPDGWTDIIYHGKPAKDSPRYKAIGNSMAVNVMRWIGLRIVEIEKITTKQGDKK